MLIRFEQIVLADEFAALSQQTSLTDVLFAKNETIRTNFERKSIETYNRCTTVTSDSLVFKTKNLELVIHLF